MSDVLPGLRPASAGRVLCLVSVCWYVLPRGATPHLYVHSRTHMSIHTDKPHHARSAWQSIRVQPSLGFGEEEGGGGPVGEYPVMWHAYDPARRACQKWRPSLFPPYPRMDREPQPRARAREGGTGEGCAAEPSCLCADLGVGEPVRLSRSLQDPSVLQGKEGRGGLVARGPCYTTLLLRSRKMSLVSHTSRLCRRRNVRPAACFAFAGRHDGRTGCV